MRMWTAKECNEHARPKTNHWTELGLKHIAEPCHSHKAMRQQLKKHRQLNARETTSMLKSNVLSMSNSHSPTSFCSSHLLSKVCRSQISVSGFEHLHFPMSLGFIGWVHINVLILQMMSKIGSLGPMHKQREKQFINTKTKC